ncbi:hypothetical protein [Comamonas terrigena]|nr:hypothetical protein [Comamonas terrigena]BBL25466.1 hypothetical protein CT3_29210 [Comamonas terrigena NBRC 13299]SUY70961.1 Uncharacterised protein [Comamonas terrigena]
MKKKSALMALAFAACVSAAHAEPFKGTIEQVIEKMRDYSASNNTFQVLSKQPLHIRLSPKMVAAETSESVKTELLRAATYGVYRTFIHTHVDRVQVTARPLLMVINGEHREFVLLKKPSATVSVSRAKALEVARQTLQVTSFSQLVDAHDMWTDKMENGRYVNRKPGLHKLADDLDVDFSH